MLRFLEPIDYADVPPGPTSNGPLADALFEIRRSGRCQRYSWVYARAAGQCFLDRKRAFAVYTDDQACQVCVADKALKDGGFLIEVIPPMRQSK